MGDPRRSNSCLSFRPLERSDFPFLQKWLAAPHVAIWWNESFDPLSLEAKNGPRIDGREAVHVYLILHQDAPIGWIQWYRWRDFPEHAAQLGVDADSAGIDLAIGEVAMTGLGLGPAILREFAKTHIFVDSDVSAIAADPAASNARSVRAFEKAGFRIVRTVQLPGEGFERMVARFDRP